MSARGGSPLSITCAPRLNFRGDACQALELSHSVFGGQLMTATCGQYGTALRAAHAEGIVHRDVKPANILMAPGRVVLADFGIARAAGTSGLTTAGALIGSPAFIAPESARGGRPGPPGDLWGLGICLYAAVEGHAPSGRAGGVLACLMAVATDEPEPPARAGPLWPVISGPLRKDPGERLGTAGAERMLRHADSGPAVPGVLAAQDA